MKHLERDWNSLTDLNNYIEKNTNEKFIEFSGFELITSKGIYGLAFKKLSFRKINE